MSQSMNEMVEAVKRHAQANYVNGGWDIVVECFEDKELAEELVGCASTDEAIATIERIVSLHHDRRTDIQAERF